MTYGVNDQMEWYASKKYRIRYINIYIYFFNINVEIN